MLETTAPSGGRRGRMESVRIRPLGPLLIFAQALVWIVLDQWSKWWAESELEEWEYVPLWGDIFGFRLVYNPGAAFGMAADFTWILSIIAAIAVVALIVLSLRTDHWLWVIGFGALTGGAISHLGDRLFRDPGFAVGHIVDFLDYAGFFVGNIADIALVGGAGILILATLLGLPRAHSERDEDQDESSLTASPTPPGPQQTAQ